MLFLLIYFVLLAWAAFRFYLQVVSCLLWCTLRASWRVHTAYVKLMSSVVDVASTSNGKDGIVAFGHAMASSVRDSLFPPSTPPPPATFPLLALAACFDAVQQLRNHIALRGVTNDELIAMLGAAVNGETSLLSVRVPWPPPQRRDNGDGSEENAPDTVLPLQISGPSPLALPAPPEYRRDNGGGARLSFADSSASADAASLLHSLNSIKSLLADSDIQSSSLAAPPIKKESMSPVSSAESSMRTTGEPQAAGSSKTRMSDLFDSDGDDDKPLLLMTTEAPPTKKKKTDDKEEEEVKGRGKNGVSSPTPPSPRETRSTAPLITRRVNKRCSCSQPFPPLDEINSLHSAQFRTLYRLGKTFKDLSKNTIVATLRNGRWVRARVNHLSDDGVYLGIETSDGKYSGRIKECTGCEHVNRIIAVEKD